jgi:hypothetical protein
VSRIRVRAAATLAATCLASLVSTPSSAQLLGSRVFRAAGVEVTLPAGFPAPVHVPSSDGDSVYMSDAGQLGTAVIIVSPSETPAGIPLSERREMALGMGSTGASIRLQGSMRGLRIDTHPTLSVPASAEWDTRGFVFESLSGQSGRNQTYVPRTGPVRSLTLRLVRPVAGDPMNDFGLGAFFGSVHFTDAPDAPRAVAVGDEHVSMVLPATLAAFQPQPASFPWIARQYRAQDAHYLITVAIVELPGDFATPASRRRALRQVMDDAHRDLAAVDVPEPGDTPTHLAGAQIFAVPDAPGSKRYRFAQLRTFVPRTGPLRAVVVGILSATAWESSPPDPVLEDMLGSIEFTGTPQPQP